MKKVRIEFEVSNKAARDLEKYGIGGVTVIHANYEEYNNTVFPASLKSRFYSKGHRFYNAIFKVIDDKALA